MSVTLKNAYEKATSSDGYRILVDRLWPRGRSKDEASIDEWLKEVAPSDGLRKSFHDGALDWGAFRKAYLAELKGHREELRRLVQLAAQKEVTLVFSAHDQEHNNAVVLGQYLKMLGAPLTNRRELH